MVLIANLGDWSLTTFSLALVAVMMAAREAGYRIGSARAEMPDEAISVLVGGLLGLMSFVLAFNLSTSTTRLEDRRGATLAEATAIGTAWLQSRAVGDAHGSEIAALLEEYLAARRAYAVSDSGSPENADATKSSAKLQGSIWAEMTALLAKRSDPQTVSLSNALTHTFDMTRPKCSRLKRASLPGCSGFS